MAATEQQAAIARTRQGYADFDAGNVEAVNALLANDVVWRSPGASRFAGEYRGKQAVFEFFGRLMQEGLVQKHEIHDVLASDQHVVVLATVTATYKGRSLTSQVVDVHHENADGELTEFWRITNDVADFDALVGS